VDSISEYVVTAAGRLLPHDFLQTCHSGRNFRPGHPMSTADPKLSSVKIRFQESGMVAVNSPRFDQTAAAGLPLVW
jgi:hypothetical protein